MYNIYIIQNVSTDMVYIGQSIDVKGRFRRHKSDLNLNRHPNKHLQSAWNKYGEENFIFYVLDNYPSQLELNQAENLFIKWYQDLKLAYNFESYSKGTGPLSTETKKKISLANKGKKRSEEVKKAMSDSRKGRKLTDYQKQALILSNKTRIVSQETKRKMRNAKLGKPQSESHKATYAYRKTKEKSFRILSPEGEIFESSNIAKFCRLHNLTQSNLVRVINGKAKHHKGWTLI